MQYNKETRAEVLTRRRCAKEETETLAHVTSFGLSWEGEESGWEGRPSKEEVG